LRKYVLTFLCILLTLGCCACEFDVSLLIEQPLPTKTPSIGRAEEYVEMPKSGLQGTYYLDIYPVYGESLRISDNDLLGMVLDAIENNDNIDETINCPLENTIVVRNASDTVLTQFSLASDGCKYARREDNTIFELPEAVYYAIQNALWQQWASLKDPIIIWDGQEEDTRQLELWLPFITQAMAQSSHGYSDAYLSNYEIFDVAFEEDRVRIYTIVSYAGYAIEGGKFYRKFYNTTPATFTFLRTSGKKWMFTAYREPTDKTDRTAVRNITPFEVLDEMMTAMEDTEELEQQVQSLARDWLIRKGLAAIDIIEE